MCLFLLEKNYVALLYKELTDEEDYVIGINGIFDLKNYLKSKIHVWRPLATLLSLLPNI